MASIFIETASPEGRDLGLPISLGRARGSRCGRAFLTLAVGVAVVCLFGLAASARAAADTVTNTSDSGPGSLRAVIAGADGGDTIVFDASLDGQTIDLTSGAIAIDKSLTIAGPGASQLTIDAGHNSRIFTLTAGDLSISGLTLANGATAPRGGAIEQTSTGSLTISDTTFSGNTAGGPGGDGEGSGFGRGGAIYVSASSGSTSISDTTFTANTAGGPGGSGQDSGRGVGGAIRDAGGGSLTISSSTFTANTAGGDGGGGTASGAGGGGAIAVAGGGGSLTVSGSTFTANTAGGDGGGGSNSGDGLGGAIDVSFGSPAVSDSTFAGNSAGGDGGVGPSSGDASGGAIYAFAASLSVSNSTWVGNAAGGNGARGSGGAIALAGNSSATLASVTIDGNSVGDDGDGAGISDANPVGVDVADVTARATIVSGNTGATNCNAPVASSSYSLEGPSSSDTSCGFDLPSADPQLAPLASNGGPTETQALPPSSPAVDAVPMAACPTSTDQRGEPRPEIGDAFCDVGAFELQDPLVAPAITSGAAATFQVGKAGSVAVTATGVPAPSLSQTGALPSGVGFTDSGDGTASLAGTPTAGTGGVYPITIKASNGVSPDAMQSFTLTVQAPPTVAIATPTDGATYELGQAVNTSFTCAEGAAGPGIASCTDQDGHLSGATLDTTTLGRHTLTVTATSQDGLTGSASISYRVVPKPEPPVAVKLSLDVERKALRKLLRTGKLVVAARVNEAAKVALTGRAKLKVHARRAQETRLVAVFKRKTVRFVAAGEKRVTLVLTRKGRRALRRLRKVRLVIAGRAIDAAGETAKRRVGLTLRR